MTKAACFDTLQETEGLKGNDADASLHHSIQQACAEALQHTLSSAKSNKKACLSVYNVLSEPRLLSKGEAVLPHLDMDQYQTYLQERTLLVSIKDSLESSLVFVLGMTANEYVIIEKTTQVCYTSLVYIEKIDSTGLSPITSQLEFSLGRMMVKAYLAYCYSTLPRPVNIHVFARAQPQFLFPESAGNQNKHILSERNLVKWWKKALGSWVLPHQETLKGYYYIPNESPQTIPDIVKTGQDASIEWSWGWPYPQSEPASAHIPRFPDDAKTRAFSMISPQDSISDFVQVLSALGEFSFGRFAGFFILSLKQDEDKKDDKTAFKYASGGIPMKQYSAFQKLLMVQNYSSLSNGIDSTSAIMEFLKKAGIHGDEIDIPLPSDMEPTTEKSAARPISQVLNVQGLVKKKQKLDNESLDSPPVLNVQSLIKKKNPTPSINNIQNLVKKSSK